MSPSVRLPQRASTRAYHGCARAFSTPSPKSRPALTSIWSQSRSRCAAWQSIRRTWIPPTCPKSTCQIFSFSNFRELRKTPLSASSICSPLSRAGYPRSPRAPCFPTYRTPFRCVNSLHAVMPPTIRPNPCGRHSWVSNSRHGANVRRPHFGNSQSRRRA